MTDRNPEVYPDDDLDNLVGVFAEMQYKLPPEDVVGTTPDPRPLPEGPTLVTHAEILLDPITGMPLAMDRFSCTEYVAPAIYPETLESLKGNDNE